MVGQAGAGQSFDGNGSFLRLAAPGGDTIVKSGRRASIANRCSPTSPRRRSARARPIPQGGYRRYGAMSPVIATRCLT